MSIVYNIRWGIKLPTTLYPLELYAARRNKGKKFFNRIFCPYFSISVCCLTYFKYRIYARHMYALPHGCAHDENTLHLLSAT